MLFSEPKIPQKQRTFICKLFLVRFSALQRAENSSNLFSRLRQTYWRRFSALQRAENSSNILARTRVYSGVLSFSALQRAENSSNVVRTPGLVGDFDVSVLFSEPKIPQIVRGRKLVVCDGERFSALQRAENSSNCSQPSS